MQRVIIIGAGLFQVGLIKKAREMELESHVFAWQDGAIGANYADYFYPVDIRDKEAILHIAKTIDPSAVLSVGSDLAVPTVNYVAGKMGLIGNSMLTSYNATDKLKMKTILHNAGLPVAKFQLINDEAQLQELSMKYPIIIKPTDRSGSRGVTKVNTHDDLLLAYRRAVKESFSGEVMVEEYIAGKEYSLEMLSCEGRHYHFATTEKFTTGEPYFIETAQLQPGCIDKHIELKAIDLACKAQTALQIEYGATNSEFTVTEDGSIYLMEVAARMGGDFVGSDLIKLSSGHDFLRYAWEIALGKSFALTESVKCTHCSYVRFIFSEADVKEYIRLLHDRPTSIVCASDDVLNVPSGIIDSSTRGGYYIVRIENKNCQMGGAREHFCK